MVKVSAVINFFVAAQQLAAVSMNLPRAVNGKASVEALPGPGQGDTWRLIAA